jgi:alpha-mannosidase
MKRHRHVLLVVCLLGMLSPLAARQRTAGTAVLWSIGRVDGDNAELALAPKGYRQLRDDPVFVVGRSNAAADWPYAQPGPKDGWAGSRPHTFTVLFTLAAPPRAGTCRLRLDLVDAHADQPPALRIDVNQARVERQLTAGAGDPSIDGQPARGKPQQVVIDIAASALRPGPNRVDITTVAGSWFLYDAVRFEVPEGTSLGAPFEGTLLLSATPRSVWLNGAAGPVQPIDVRILHEGAPLAIVASARVLPASSVRPGGRGNTGARPPLHPAAPASNETGGEPSTLQRGVQTLALQVPASERPSRAAIEITGDGRALAMVEAPITPPAVKDLWLLAHSHVDIGYTHLQQEVETHHVEHLNTVLRLAEATANEQPGERFAWNTEAMWPVDLWLKQASAEDRARFMNAVSRGQIGINALYANVLTALPRPEELLRVLEPAVRFSAATGVHADTAVICDVPGYTWGLVSAMAQAGVRYFAIAPNASDRVGTIHAFDYQPFWWVGPTGRERVLAYVVDNYHANGDLERNLLAAQQHLADIAYAYDLAPVFWSGRWPNGGVDNPPPDETLVEKVKAWNAKYARPRARIATAGEFFAELEKRAGATLPERRGDMTPYWEDGAASTSRETALNRWSSERLSQAETLWAIVAPDRRPAARFSEAWTRAVMYSEHTWGAYNSTSEPDLPFVKAQWAYKQAFALDADRQSRQLLDEAVAMRGPSGTTTGEFDVINTTQWPRTELVVVPERLARIGGRVVDNAGSVVPSQRLNSNELVFLARDVAPFGTARFRVTAGQPSGGGAHAAASGTELTTSQLTVRVDRATGAIASLRLAGDGTDYVDATAGVGLNDFRYVLGEDSAHARSNGAVKMAIVDGGPLVVTVSVQSDAPGCKGLVREIRVVDGLDYVTLTNRVDRLGVREKDAVHFAFGFNVPGGAVRIDTPWATVRPDVDQLAVANRNWYTAQRFVDVANAERGVTLAPLDAPLVQVGGMTANLLGSVATNRWMRKAIASQTLYSWAQNNHWHTNYKADQPGITTFRYLVRPRRSAWSAAGASRFGLESTRPLIVVPAAGSEAAGPVLAVSSPDVIIETVKASEDGGAIIVRLFGASDRERQVTLTGRLASGAMAITDLTEKPLKPAGGSITVPAQGVVSVRIEHR